MRYYVYQHVDPQTKEIVYVGHGSGGRAWQCGSSHSPLRSQDHKAWADELLNFGFTPDEFVTLLSKGLTKEEAKKQERQLIHNLKPIYNKDIRSKSLKFVPEIYYKCIELRKNGLSYDAIGKEVRLSTMAVHRGLNKMPISLEIALEQG